MKLFYIITTNVKNLRLVIGKLIKYIIITSEGIMGTTISSFNIDEPNLDHDL